MPICPGAKVPELGETGVVRELLVVCGGARLKVGKLEVAGV